jgi:transglutaminase superfamily protein
VKKQSRRAAFSSIVVGVALLFAFTWRLPWSARWRHALSKMAVKMAMKVSAWQGVEPKLVSLSGRVIVERPRKDSIKGAQVEALDSTSGWASLTDEHGKFVLRDVTWYPSATYKLIVQANPYQSRQITVTVPTPYPESGILDLAELNFDDGCVVDPNELLGRNSISYLDFDAKNLAFYQQRFEEATRDKRTDEAKLEAINRYVATKFDLDMNDGREEPPRSVLENGTAFCGKLALALATLAEAADYKSRLINVIYEAPQSVAHMVTEVFFGDRWHIYDATSSSAFRDISHGNPVPGYKELRLNPGLVSFQVPEHLPAMNGVIGSDIYKSGLHHYYYLRRRR